ncbi:hypothetical protein Dimus_022683 [Dionaea muscipula]
MDAINILSFKDLVDISKAFLIPWGYGYHLPLSYPTAMLIYRHVVLLLSIPYPSSVIAFIYERSRNCGDIISLSPVLVSVDQLTRWEKGLLWMLSEDRGDIPLFHDVVNLKIPKDHHIASVPHPSKS